MTRTRGALPLLVPLAPGGARGDALVVAVAGRLAGAIVRMECFWGDDWSPALGLATPVAWEIWTPGETWQLAETSLGSPVSHGDRAGASRGRPLSHATLVVIPDDAERPPQSAGSVWWLRLSTSVLGVTDPLILRSLTAEVVGGSVPVRAADGPSNEPDHRSAPALRTRLPFHLSAPH